jgi:hypothetical protein
MPIYRRAAIAVIVLASLLLSGCSQMQVYLDEQSHALQGILPIAGHSVNKWTTQHGDVTLQKTLATQKYRLVSTFLKKPIDLSLNTVENVQIFNLDGQDTFVFRGTFGQKQQAEAYEVVTIGRKNVRLTRFPIKTYPLVFRPSANGKNLLGAPPSPTKDSSFFVATTDEHYFPFKFSQLAPDDGELYWASIPPQTVKWSTSKRTPVAKKGKPSASEVRILAPAPEPDLPTRTKVVEQSTVVEKPVLKLD